MHTVPLYACTTLFLTHSSADGRLDFFHVLTTVNSVAANIGVCVSFKLVFSLDTCPGVGLQNHVV